MANHEVRGKEAKSVLIVLERRACSPRQSSYARSNRTADARVTLNARSVRRRATYRGIVGTVFLPASDHVGGFAIPSFVVGVSYKTNPRLALLLYGTHVLVKNARCSKSVSFFFFFYAHALVQNAVLVNNARCSKWCFLYVHAQNSFLSFSFFRGSLTIDVAAVVCLVCRELLSANATI